ncbi:hypothetical protein [Sphingomonas sp. CFBP8993]
MTRRCSCRRWAGRWRCTHARCAD